MDEREKDIQRLCKGVIEMGVDNTGDYRSGAQCPFCFADCHWDAKDLAEVNHEPDCIYLIAKDLSTGLK